MDIRWASDRSVFLALLKEGTVEAGIDGETATTKEWIAGNGQRNGFWFCSRVASSPDYLVAAATVHGLTWRTLRESARREASFDQIVDIDVWKDQLLVLGDRRNDKGIVAPEGALAWIGSLTNNLADLKPVLFDAGGPHARNLDRCGLLEVGAVRFLGDGSFIVVPGVQPGAHLFDRHAKLVRSWDTASLGLDSDCAALSAGEVQEITMRSEPRGEWINRRQIVDDIVALGQDPGLIVRSLKSGKVQWDLKVLMPDGSVRVTRIPLTAQTRLSRLKADVRGARIVFLMSAFKKDGMRMETPRLIVAELARL